MDNANLLEQFGPGGGSKGRDRSPPFPFINLTKALERARAFYAEEKRGAAPLGRAVMHWGYSESSSGGLQTAAALRHYGLLDDVGGSGRERQLRLTELALRILLDTRPESVERDSFIRQAAMTPTVAQEVYERWPEGLPSDTTLNHYLVLDRKFNETTAATAVRILKENQQLTSFSQVPVESPAQVNISDRNDGGREMDVLTTRGETRGMPVTLSASTPYAIAPPETIAHPVEFALRHRGVAIYLRFSEEPSKETFTYLEKYCGFEKDNWPEASKSGSDQAAGS